MDSNLQRKKNKNKTKKQKQIVRDFSALFQALSAETAHLDQKYKKRDVLDYVARSLTEYFSNYIIIGYTPDGEPAVITHAQTHKDVLSLHTLIHHHMYRMQHNDNPDN